MPATEQTWRDSKLMHLVFGVTALIMLVSTIWVMVVDHQREWKGYQRTIRDVEAGTAEARIAQQNNAQYSEKLKEYREKLDAARQEVPPLADISLFLSEIKHGSQEKITPPYNETQYHQLETDYESLSKANPEDRPALRDRLFEDARQYIREASFIEANALRAKKFAAASLDVTRSDYELAVGKNAGKYELESLQKRVDGAREKVDELTATQQQATIYRKALDVVLGRMLAKEAKARKDLDEQVQKLTRLDDVVADRQYDWAKELLSMPIIDAFGRPLKVEQIWLPKLTINNNFRDVARFDRCITCHLAIEKTLLVRLPRQPIRRIRW